MSVLIANTYAGVRRRDDTAQTFDEYDTIVEHPLGAMVGPWPAQATEDPDGHWLIAVDDAAWPVRQYDVIVETDAAGTPTGQTWTVTHPSLHTNALAPAVDFVRCLAQQNQSGGAEPVGTEFVGR